jgi:hypothetical protein
MKQKFSRALAARGGRRCFTATRNPCVALPEYTGIERVITRGRAASKPRTASQTRGARPPRRMSAVPIVLGIVGGIILTFGVVMLCLSYCPFGRGKRTVGDVVREERDHDPMAQILSTWSPEYYKPGSPKNKGRK